MQLRSAWGSSQKALCTLPAAENGFAPENFLHCRPGQHTRTRSTHTVHTVNTVNTVNTHTHTTTVQLYNCTTVQ